MNLAFPSRLTVCLGRAIPGSARWISTWLGLVLVLLNTGCGTFPAKISAADKAQTFRKPLVVSLIGPEVTISKMGFTNFDRKDGRSPVPEWGIDGMVEQIVVQKLKQQGIAARTPSPALRAQLRSLTWSKLEDAPGELALSGAVKRNPAILGDSDSVVFILGATVPNTSIRGPGLASGPLGRDGSFCGGIRVFVDAVPSGRQFAWAHDHSNGTERGDHADLPYKQFHDYSPAEREHLRSKITEVTRRCMNEALAGLGI